MKNLMLTALAASIVATPVYAKDTNESTSKHEAAGLGAGLAIGAAAGGPVGAVIGAAIGAMFGDRFNEQKTARIESEQQAELARADANALQTRLRGSENRIAQMQRQIAQEQRSYRAAVQQALNAEIFFRTGESELSEESVARLGDIAGIVRSMDGFVVSLSGHADARGDEEYNEQLSAQRAAAVRDALVAAGFPSSRISLTAEGERESAAPESDLDALAMERRVRIELIANDSDSLVAARP